MKQVTVMANYLNMRKGKMIAQGQHASGMFMLDLLLNGRAPSNVQRKWMMEGMTKVCVRAESEEELLKLAKDAQQAGLTVHIITDAGHTEFHGVPTITCFAVGPDHEDKIDAVTGCLKLL